MCEVRVETEEPPLLLGLDAFGDDGHPEIFGEFEELGGYRGAVRVLVYSPYQARI